MTDRKMSVLECQGYNGNIYYTIVNTYGYIFHSSAWESEHAAMIAYNRDPDYYERFGWTHYR